VKRSESIQSKLKQKPLDSKKALYALVAGACVLMVFGISAILILAHAEQAKEITELANLVVMFFAAICTTLITGQAVTDFKCVSALQHIDEDTDSDEHIESNQPLAPEVNICRRDPKDYLLEHDTTI
jgi:membrane protein YdbS with pleckstrin-like domain